MRNATLAAIQPPHVPKECGPEERKAENVEAAFALMEQAATEGADLMCLPEHFPMTGVTGDAPTKRELADEEGGELSRRLCEFARRAQAHIVAPVTARYGDTLRNVAWIISKDGELAGRFFKVHLTHGEHEKGIIPGDEWPVFELDGVRVGVMICHDNNFPESARCLALNGADVICWPHVETGWGDIEFDVNLRSRAVDNSVYLLTSCNGVPADRAWRPGMIVGRSSVTGPDGIVLADGGRRPGVVSTTVDLDRVHLKHHFTFLGDHDCRESIRVTRRPETYAAISRPASPEQDG